mgnify:FL=1
MIVTVALLSCSKKEVKTDSTKDSKIESMQQLIGCSGGCNASTGNGETGCGEAIASWATDCKCWQHTTTPKPPCTNPPCN